jgi:hypothetical protein
MLHRAEPSFAAGGVMKLSGNLLLPFVELIIFLATPRLPPPTSIWGNTDEVWAMNKSETIVEYPHSNRRMEG